MEWRWFLGGQIMFWIATILLILFVYIYTITFVIDPITNMYIEVQNTDETSIKEISENYIKSLGITIHKPICYRFVKYKNEDHFKTSNDVETVLLGTFHEWNNTYFINISVNLYKMSILSDVVKHETRHMLVQELKNEGIMDLSDYTEEIAQEKNETYNNLFNCGISLLKNEQNFTTTSVR